MFIKKIMAVFVILSMLFSSLLLVNASEKAYKIVWDREKWSEVLIDETEKTEETTSSDELANGGLDPIALIESWDGTDVAWDGLKEDPYYYSNTTNVPFISCSEYLAKYKKCENEKYRAELSEMQLATLDDIANGVYCGMKIIDVSDLPINHPYFSVRCVSPIIHPDIVIPEKPTVE